MKKEELIHFLTPFTDELDIRIAMQAGVFADFKLVYTCVHGEGRVILYPRTK